MVTAPPTLQTRHVEKSDRMFGQERENKTRDVVVLLQGGMPAIEQVDFGIRQIVLERASDDNWQVREQLSCAHRAARVLPLSKSIRPPRHQMQNFCLEPDTYSS